MSKNCFIRFFYWKGTLNFRDTLFANHSEMRNLGMAFWRVVIICSHSRVVAMILYTISVILLFGAERTEKKIVDHLAATKWPTEITVQQWQISNLAKKKKKKTVTI